MQLNHEYARVINGELDYAPMRPNPCQLTPTTAAQYLALGYYPLAHNQPLEPAAAGYHWDRLNSTVVDGAIYDNFTQVADAPVVHTYSKLKLIVALSSRNLVGTFLYVLEREGLMPMWYAAQELRSDYPNFDTYVNKFCTAWDLTDETRDAILSEAEVGNA